MKRTTLFRRSGTILAAAMIMMASEVHASRLFLTTNTFRATAHVSGQQYFTHNGIFQINQIRQGLHFIRIIQNGDGYARGRRGGEIFRGQLVVPPLSDVYARVTRSGELTIDRIVPKRRVQTHQNQQIRRGNSTNYRRDSRRNGERYTAPANSRVQGNFSAALRTIQLADFDNHKKTIAKQYLRDNTVTSRQVLQMIQVFDFESSKLEIAKHAYSRTRDPENYFLVNQGFDFTSSSNALSRFIR